MTLENQQTLFLNFGSSFGESHHQNIKLEICVSGDQSHVMSVIRSSVHAKWIVGKVIGTAMQKTAKVRVTRLVLDPYLLKVRTCRVFFPS